MKTHQASAEVYDIHLVLRLHVPEEARVAKAIQDAGPRLGKSYLCRCVLQALDKDIQSEETKEILRILRRLEQMYMHGLSPSGKSAEVPEDATQIRVPVPPAVLAELRKFHQD